VTNIDKEKKNEHERTVAHYIDSSDNIVMGHDLANANYQHHCLVILCLVLA